MTRWIVLLAVCACGGANYWQPYEAAQNETSQGKAKTMAAAQRSLKASGADIVESNAARGLVLGTWQYDKVREDARKDRYRLRFGVSEVGYQISLDCEVRSGDFWQACPKGQRAAYMLRKLQATDAALSRELAR